MAVRTLDDLNASGKRILMRADLNVPLRDGQITDLTRLERLLPTIRELSGKGAKVILCSHFGRPKGKRVPEMSLAPVAVALGQVLGRRVRFAEDCIGIPAHQSVERMRDGDILVLENTRYDPREEKNDPGFAGELAKLADAYVNDAFSASHRAHASTEAVAHLLPAYAGRLMEEELNALHRALGNPVRPVMAVVGGAKVSTKLELLGNLVGKVELLAIGGAMANTFLAARGVGVGKSLQEADMHQTALGILDESNKVGCEVVLPVDAVVAQQMKADIPAQTVDLASVPDDSMILDVGADTTALLSRHLATIKTLVWNGPLGAFEVSPFDAGTTAFAKAVAEATERAGLLSVAGGGDTVSALRHAGVLDRMSYVSTAGGAFLEWLEGKTLPGVKALEV